MTEFLDPKFWLGHVPLLWLLGINAQLGPSQWAVPPRPEWTALREKPDAFAAVRVELPGRLRVLLTQGSVARLQRARSVGQLANR